MTKKGTKKTQTVRLNWAVWMTVGVAKKTRDHAHAYIPAKSREDAQRECRKHFLHSAMLERVTRWTTRETATLLAASRAAFGPAGTVCLRKAVVK